MDPSLCGSTVASDLVGVRAFKIVFEYDYYDGAVNGLLRCGDGSRYYRFEMLKWDAKQSVRVFGLSLIPERVASECIELNSVAEHTDSVVEREAAFLSLMSILRQYDMMEYVIAWNRSDEALLAAKYVGARSLRLPDTVFWNRPDDAVDWFAFVGLSHGNGAV